MERVAAGEGRAEGETTTTNFTEQLARASARRPWVTIACWIVTLVVAFGLVGALFSSALSSDRSLPGSESQKATSLLKRYLPKTQRSHELILVRSSTLTVEDPAFRTTVEQVYDKVNGSKGVFSVTDYYRQPSSSLVSADMHATILPVEMTANSSDGEKDVEPIVKYVQSVSGKNGVDAFITGHNTNARDQGTLSQDDLRNGELFLGAPAAMVILVLVFGALVAAFLPLLLAILSIGIALGLVAILGQFFDLSIFTINILTGMGLALGIDYSLFVLSRYREERARGREKIEAIAAAGGTSGRAVFFSGIVFVFALFGMLLVPNSVMRSLGLGAILAGVVAIVGALTLMPALLALLGDRVNALHVPVLGRGLQASSGREGRFCAGVARVVMRRPVVSLALAGGVLVALTIPAFDLNIGSSGVAQYPDRAVSKQGLIALKQAFPNRSFESADIVVKGDVSSASVQAGIDRLKSALAADPDFSAPTVQVDPGGNVALVSAAGPADAESEHATKAVDRLRKDVIPGALTDTSADVLVTGTAAEALDAANIIHDWLPIVFVFVLGLSFIMLTIAFRSLVVSLKAMVLNLLAVGATYGLIVLVFQKGYGHSWFGFTKIDSVESWVPLFLFSVLFALSMDYHVFLLSRIRERFTETGNNTEAVAIGVSSTARLITGAALIMVAVFVGFASGDLIMFQQMGFGLAVALLLDATIIRSVLVPASMKLLGAWNWYLPSWLSWLPHFEVETEHQPTSPHVVQPSG
jgi:uncharacterized membrane protein YdfJ with MMPL/SSD domain